jgi:DsbC/DsbD-like thiol-disulfide interchange protein
MRLRILAATALVVLTFCPAWAQPRDKRFQKVSAAVKARPRQKDGTQQLVIELTVVPGWRIYANPVGPPEFEDVRLRVTVNGQKPLKKATIHYPKPEVIKSQITGDLKVYRGKVSIIVDLIRDDSQTGPLEIALLASPVSNDFPAPMEAIRLTVP